MISLESICVEYLHLFSNKDIDTLSDMFADNIELIDWNVKAKGKHQVIEEYKNIFNNVKSIQAYRKKFYECDNTMLCEIEIFIDDKEKIEVIDVITFNSYMKIKKIKAYKI